MITVTNVWNNMAKHLDTGNRGEALAREFLEAQGYEILETNWRFSRAEIDLIAMDGDIMVFVEVKTRSNDRFGSPESFVTTRKETLIADAASVYMEQSGHDWEIRFDVISVLLPQNGKPSVKHFKDAFFPGLH